jgi:lysophospholipase L1-like esterase
VFLGDSITQGQGQGGGTAGAFPAFTGAQLGWTVVNQGVGSTGYLRDTLGDTFRARVSTVVAATPDVVIVEGGGGDTFFCTLTQFQAEVPLFFAALRAALPAIPVYVLSPSARANDAGLVASFGAALQAAAVAAGCVYIDWNPWITGTGYVGHLIGDGNADVYVAADATHPSAAGHPYVGTRLAFAIRPPNTGLVG